MNLLVPWALAWGAASFAVVVLYMLRRRERELPVSALFLWEKVPPDAMSRLARWLPRTDLLLWAQIAVVLLMALALAAPVVIRARPAGATAIVVDTSLTLAPQGRAREARDVAQELVAKSAGPWVLVGWSDPPEVLVGPTTREEEIMAGIAKLSYSISARSPLSHALALVPQGWERVVVVSGAPPQDAQVEVVTLSPVDNLAIEAFAVRSQPDGSHYQALVTVRNDSDRYEDMRVTVRDVAGGRSFRQARLVAPQKSDTFLFPLWGAVGPAYVAELSPQDGFPYDNVRYYALDMPPTLRLRWVGEDDRYLWAGLRAVAHVERADEPPWDLTVVVREDLEEPVNGPCLLVEGGLAEAPRGELVPAGQWTATSDVLLAHVDTGLWAAETLHALAVPDGGEVPLRSGDQPAVARWHSPEGRRVALTVHLRRSNLPQTLGFPVLLRNALAWLLPWPEGGTATVGRAVQLAEGTSVDTSAGKAVSVWVPHEPGLFELQEGGRSRYVATNIPHVPLRGERSGLVSPQAPAEQSVAGWPWVVGVLLALLGGEWLLARRRGV